MAKLPAYRRRGPNWNRRPFLTWSAWFARDVEFYFSLFFAVFHRNDFGGEHLVCDFARGAECSVNIDPIGCQWHGACLKKKGRKGEKEDKQKPKKHHIIIISSISFSFWKEATLQQMQNVGGRNDRAAHLFFPSENDSNSLLHLCVDRKHVPAFWPAIKW